MTHTHAAALERARDALVGAEYLEDVPTIAAIEAAILAYLAACREAGWKMVPLVSTDAMDGAVGAEATSWSEPCRIWEAGYDAAPDWPGSGGEG